MGLAPFFIVQESRNMEDRAPILFSKSDELHDTAVGRALWQTVRRPRRGRMTVQPAFEPGPYETNYSISSGYPDREIVLP
jgi:hypothetical protein